MYYPTRSVDAGIDLAISVSMEVDHGAVQPLEKLFGDARTSDFTDSGVGRLAPIHCTALGKVLLASLDAKAADAVIDSLGMRRHTGVTITNYGRLREELGTIRRRGWGYDLEESF